MVASPGDLDAARQALIRQRLAGGRGGGRTDIPVADRAGRLPLSFGQERLWFLSQLAPDSTEYQIPVVLNLRGTLDLEALRAACRQVLHRHEILRTHYQLSDARPIQVIDPPQADGAIRISDVSDLNAARRLSQSFELARRHLAQPFDLGLDRPIRIRLIRLAADEHIIVIAVHHIAADGWSLNIFMRDLFECYTAAAEGRRPVLPPLPVQYADYAIWQRNRVTGDLLGRHLAYWREQLAGLMPLELPTDRPRGAVRDWAGERVTLTVPPPLAARLHELARQQRTTLFVVTLTAFQLLLGRYADQRDVAVGSALTSRTAPELQDLMGFFLDTIVLRARWTSDLPFLALLDRNRQTVLDGVGHQEAPLQALVDELGDGRDLSRTPLFQVMFDMIEAQPDAMCVPGLQIAPLSVLGDIAKHDLRLELAEDADGSLLGSLEYATALFDASTIHRMTGHYLRLLASIAADPRQPVSRLEFLDPAERKWLIAQCNGPSSGRPPEHVADAVARWARRTPAAIAVSGGMATLSYAELDTRANQVAHLLLGLGLKPRSVVGVCLDRGVDLLPVLVGVWRAGCAYLPLGPEDPPGRTAHVLGDSAAALVVTTSDRLARFPDDLAARAVLVDMQRSQLAAQPGTDPGRAADPDDLAYLIYTSGSTGHPKGVLVTHRGLMNYLWWAAETYLTSDGGAPLFASIAFDLAVTTLYTPLLAGQPVYMLPPDFDLTELGPLLTQAAGGHYSFVKLTPAHLELLCLQLDAGQAAGLTTQLVVGGEGFAGSLARRWHELAGPDGELTVNEYGPTEVCVASIAQPGIKVPDVAAPSSAPRFLPIGRPIPNTTAYILDDELELVPVGVVGDLYVGGTQLARGYHGMAGLTAQRFVPDPYGLPGARLYRTGDRARRLPDGAIEFVGRSDDQIKMRGYRIEPGEIVAALRQHPDVQDAAVTVRVSGDGDPGGRVLTAYVVPAGSEPPASEELRAFAGRILPGYMVPSAFQTVRAIPLTSNGKVDYRALPGPDHDSGRPGRPADPPQSPLEHQIAGVIGRVLGLDAVGIHDNFFDLGGDSVNAVAVVGALRDAAVDLRVRDVFENSTVAGLAHVLSRRPAVTAGERRVAPFELISAEDRAKVPAGVVDVYPLSMLQRGMLFEMLGEGDGDAHYYHNATTYTIRDDHPFSLPALRAAAALMVRRQEMLRTGFDLAGFSTPVQLVHSAADLPVGVQDLRSLSVHERDRAVRDYTSAQQDTLFDITNPPLLRLFAHITSDDSWQLTITECHPILEGWGYHLLLMDLIGWYRLIRDGKPVPADEPLPIRYADFIAAELESLASAEDRDYWERIIATIPKLALPASWAGSDEPAAPRAVQVMFIDIADGLRALAKSAEVPFKSVLHAAHLTVMGMLTSQPTFFTGLVCDTRPEVTGADRLPGLFLNTVPFPFRRAAGSWRDLVRGVFASETALWPHRRYPVLALQRGLTEAGDGGRLIDILFNYLDFHSVDTELVEFEASIDDSYVEFDLAVTAFAQGVLTLRFHPSKMSSRNGERLAAMYRRVLRDMAANPDGGPQGSYLPSGEYEKLVTEWNDTEVRYPPATLPGIFEERVRADPDATAAVAADGRPVTYGELNSRANRLARHLRGLGVGLDTRVGICLDNSVELLVGVLGIVKAGGAYVPLDLRDPPGRLAFMVSDAGTAVIVTRDRLCPRLPQAGPTLVCLDRDWSEIAACPDDDQPQSARPDNLVYVIYTSGSAGAPKGVMITHRGLVNYLLWAADCYLTDEIRGAPLLGAPAQDLSVTNYLVPLAAGRAVHILPADPDAAVLAGYLARPGEFSLVKLTPAHLDLLSQYLPDGTVLSAAGTVVVGGDRLTGAAAAAWRRIAPRSRLVNEYGPTETVVGCTVFEAPAGIDAAHPVPIGRPIANVRTYVLDRDLRPVPIGVTGELYVAGAGVARGYLNDPAKTAAAFLPDPFSPVPGARCYRTGDLARYRPDGNLEFLGRADDQIKFLGFRIEPGEIEARISAHPAVSAAAVTMHEHPPGNARLVAYLTVKDGNQPQLAELRDFLGQTLPSHMLPSAAVLVDELPRTGAGKIDRGALPPPEWPTSAAAGYVAPRNNTEQAVTEVWMSVLGAERVGIEDRFTDLGGHSLAAMRVSALLRARHKLLVSPQDVLRSPTAAALAALASAPATDSSGGDTVYRKLTDGQLLGPDGVLVWLRLSGTRPVLFCAHDSATLCFGDLATELGDDWPVAAIQHPAMIDPACSGMPVIELARRYAAHIRAARPRGPYHLLAWCAGVPVVWELARQLSAAGDSVVLCLLDPKLGDPASPSALSTVASLRQCEALMDQLRADPAGPNAAGLRCQILGLLRSLFPEGVQAHHVQAGDVDEGWPEVVRAWREREQARLDYRIEELHIPVHLVASDEAVHNPEFFGRATTFDGYVTAWRYLTGGNLPLHRVPGWHDGMLRPPLVRQFAVKLTEIFGQLGQM